MWNTGLDLLAPTDWRGVLLRLGLAIVVGGMVGIERQIENKPAGLRTHMLVSLGAAIFLMISIQTGMVEEEPNTASRVMQGLVAGIGFLGAGEIFLNTRNDSDEEIRVQGLTSAAAIWVSASLGAAAGCGLWFISLVGGTATLLILWAVKKLEALLK